MQRYVKGLVWMRETCERYAQYLRFSGQNIHIMGCIQYDDGNEPFIPRDRLDSSRITLCLKTMLANVLDMNEIDFLADIPGFWPIHWTVSWRQGLQEQNPYMWIPREQDVVLSAFKGMPRCAALCRTNWDENVKITPGQTWNGADYGNRLDDSDWLLDMERTRALPQPGGYHVREALLQAIITLDPAIALTGFTDLNTNVGHEQALREVMALYTRLPAERFTPVLNTGLTRMLAIRVLNREGRSWLYVANPGYWAVEGALDIRAGAPLLDIGTGEKVADAGRATLRVRLAPFGLAAYRTASKELEVNAYETGDIGEPERAHLTSIAQRVTELAGNSEIRLALVPEDAAFVDATLKAVRAHMARKQYAQAWSRLKHYRFWSLWKQFLERAASGLARIPATMPREASIPDPDIHRTLNAVRASGQVEVDGKLKDKPWRNVPLSCVFRTASQRLPALNESGVKAVYDDESLYLAFGQSLQLHPVGM